jgi:hypothetical protein
MPVTDEATCFAKPECDWEHFTNPEPMHCVSKDRFSSTYVATTDNCMTITTLDACMNLQTVCEWKPVNDPVTPPATACIPPPTAVPPKCEMHSGSTSAVTTSSSSSTTSSTSATSVPPVVNEIVAYWGAASCQWECPAGSSYKQD